MAQISPLLIELNAQGEGKKHKISPVGDVTGVDGRVYSIDGEALLAAHKTMTTDIPVDENHMGGRALGWIYLNTLELKNDGIYGAIEWTPQGKQVVEAKEYRYLSPTYVKEGRNETAVRFILAVGLVNMPNLLNAPVNRIEKEEDMPGNDDKKEKNEGGASEVELLKTQLEEALAKIAELTKQLEEAGAENKNSKNALKVQLVDNAIKAGELLPASRDFAVKLEEGSLAEFLKLQKLNLEHLKKAADVDKNSRTDDEITKEVNRQLGL